MKLHHDPARVLVATPDRYLRAEFCAALCKERIDASTATNGVQCVEQLRRIIPDLVVLDTDLLWGGADGVLAVLADDPALPAVPAMVVSSRHSRSALYDVARFIVTDYQSKPMSGKRLVQRIRLLFKLKLSADFTGPDTMPFARIAEHLPPSEGSPCLCD